MFGHISYRVGICPGGSHYICRHQPKGRDRRGIQPRELYAEKRPASRRCPEPTRTVATMIVYYKVGAMDEPPENRG